LIQINPSPGSAYFGVKLGCAASSLSGATSEYGAEWSEDEPAGDTAKNAKKCRHPTLA
jgi:hypothetical protein